MIAFHALLVEFLSDIVLQIISLLVKIFGFFLLYLL